MTACVAVSASTVTSFAAGSDKVIENDYLRLGVDSGRFIAYKTDVLRQQITTNVFFTEIQNLITMHRTELQEFIFRLTEV